MNHVGLKIVYLKIHCIIWFSHVFPMESLGHVWGIAKGKAGPGCVLKWRFPKIGVARVSISGFSLINNPAMRVPPGRAGNVMKNWRWIEGSKIWTNPEMLLWKRGNGISPNFTFSDARPGRDIICALWIAHVAEEGAMFEPFWTQAHTQIFSTRNPDKYRKGQPCMNTPWLKK